MSMKWREKSILATTIVVVFAANYLWFIGKFNPWHKVEVPRRPDDSTVAANVHTDQVATAVEASKAPDAASIFASISNISPKSLVPTELKVEIPKKSDDSSVSPGVVIFSSLSNQWGDPSTFRLELGQNEQQLISRKPAECTRISPDGKMTAFSKSETLVVTDGTNSDVTVDKIHGLPVWSPDSRTIVCSHFGAKLDSNVQPNPGKGTWRYSIEENTKEKLPIPESHFVWDWSPDGKWFLVSTKEYTRDYYLLSARDCVTMVLLEFGEPVFRPRFGRSGKRLYYVTARIDEGSGASNSNRRQLFNWRSFNTIRARDLNLSENEPVLAATSQQVYLADPDFCISDFGCTADEGRLAVSTIDIRSVKVGKPSIGKLELCVVADGKRTALNSNVATSFYAVDIH